MTRWLQSWPSVVLVAMLIGLVAMVSRPWQAVELRLFDQMTVLAAQDKSVLPIIIVRVDEASFAEIDQRTHQRHDRWRCRDPAFP